MSDPGSAAADPALVAELERARALGFLGPGPVADHLWHSAGFVAALSGIAGSVTDLGSGGGVPGLPLALARPDLEVLLVDASRRRVAFLCAAVDALGLGARVQVLEARAEVVGRSDLRASQAAVVARGFGPAAATAECAAPLLRVGGRLAVSEPPTPAPERWPAGPLAALGLEPAGVHPGPPRIQLLQQVAPCPDRFPRRTGVPAKRPLF